MTTQFLTILDGMSSAKNILVIGTSNRKDSIDEAVIRPGRLELHIEIGLPNEEDRLAILKLKTSSLRNNGLLHSGVNLAEFAKKTPDFSGADLEFLVRSATQLAIQNNLTVAPETGNVILKPSIKSSADLAKVEAAHFDASLRELLASKSQKAPATRERSISARY